MTHDFEKIEVAGSDKPWLTMVHGATQNRKLFNLQVLEFQKSHRLLLIDLPGHGGSSSMAGPYGPEEYAAATLAAMDAAHVETTHFWGTHTGSGVGLTLGIRHTNRFSSLILEGAVIPGVELPSISRNFNRAKSTAQKIGVEAARLEWFKEAEWFAVMRRESTQMRSREHQALLSEFLGSPWLDESEAKPVFNIQDNLKKILIPVLLINGEFDVEDFLEISRKLKYELPFSQSKVIPGAGGFSLWETPYLVNKEVRNFLKNN